MGNSLKKKIRVNIFYITIKDNTNINNIMKELGNVPLYTLFNEYKNIFEPFEVQYSTYEHKFQCGKIITKHLYLLCLDAKINIHEFCKTYNCSVTGNVHTMKIYMNTYNDDYKIDRNDSQIHQYKLVKIYN